MTGWLCIMNKFTEVTCVLNKGKLPKVPAKWLVTDYGFHPCLKQKNLFHEIFVFSKMEKWTF